VVGPATRIEARAVWDLLLFGLNGLIFVLIGLQLRPLATILGRADVAETIWQGLAISAAAIVTRLVWVPIAAWLPRQVPSIAAADPMPPWKNILVVSWAAMRGVVSLAAALALPVSAAGGAPLPFREKLILLTFIFILVTLVFQGLTLAPLIRRLRLPADDSFKREEAYARHQALRAGLRRLNRVIHDLEHADPRIAELRRDYEERLQALAAAEAGHAPSSSLADAAFKRVRHAMLAAEHRKLVRLRDEGAISDDVLIELERELDLEAARHGLGDLRDASVAADDEDAHGPSATR
jgi:CPA1 family monovalent cation:H+ antiporter